MPSVKQIVREYLEKNKYDGLYDEMYGQCGCVLSDFVPCGEMMDTCCAGYQVADKTGEYDFLIVPDKPEQPK